MDKKVTINGKEYTERTIGHVNIKVDQNDDQKIENKNNSYTISPDETNAINRISLDINISGDMLKTPQSNEKSEEEVSVMNEEIKYEEYNINDENQDEVVQKQSWIKKLAETIKRLFIK